MKPYLIGFGLVFLGFIIGFIAAAMCAAAGRADRSMERSFMEEIERRRETNGQ